MLKKYIYKLIKTSKSLRKVRSDSLFQNSLFLMMNTLLISFVGFIFWTLSAKLYTTEQVGIATVFVSVMNLIITISLVGTNSAIVKYLSTQKNKNLFINTIFSIIILVSLVSTSIYIFGINVFSPKLALVSKSLLFTLFLLLFMTFASINAITDSVFIAYRKTKNIIIVNIVASLLKIAIPILLYRYGQIGILLSISFPIILASIVSLILIVKQFDVKIKFQMDRSIVHNIWRFSFANYVIGFIGSVPNFVIPVLVLNILGSKSAAYYYMPTMIITMITAIPRSIAINFFAEISNGETNMGIQVIKALSYTLLLLIPVMLMVFLFGEHILSIFGKNYPIEGMLYLRLMLISVLIGTPNGLIGAIYNSKNLVNIILSINIMAVILIISISYILIPLGLHGIALANIISQIIMILLNVSVFIYFFKNEISTSISKFNEYLSNKVITK